MVTEQNETLSALKSAIQMEIDGKQFYRQASRESRHELGKKLLSVLATEEDIHRQMFEKIYEAIRSKKAWPKIDFPPDGGKGLKTIFARATKEIGTKIKAPANELEAVQIAMSMENKTYDFYYAQSQKAKYHVEKEFYEALAAQERGHHLALLSYYEYLKDPAGWFVKTEHPHLDGG